MSYIRRVVSKYTTELEFITAFISAMTSADERICCLTNDLAEQFADESNTPHFTISIADICILTFTRIGNLGYTDYCYSVTDQNGIAAGLIYFANNPVAAAAVSKRCYKYSLAANEGVINLSLYSFNDDPGTPELSCTVIIDRNNACYGIIEDSTSAIGEDFISENNTLFKKQDRLSYILSSVNAVSAEMIKNKVFTDAASGIKTFVSDSLYDITQVTPNTVITVSAKNYYALDSHTIMEV